MTWKKGVQFYTYASGQKWCRHCQEWRTPGEHMDKRICPECHFKLRVSGRNTKNKIDKKLGLVVTST